MTSTMCITSIPIHESHWPADGGTAVAVAELDDCLEVAFVGRENPVPVSQGEKLPEPVIGLGGP